MTMQSAMQLRAAWPCGLRFKPTSSSCAIFVRGVEQFSQKKCQEILICFSMFRKTCETRSFLRAQTRGLEKQKNCRKDKRGRTRIQGGSMSSPGWQYFPETGSMKN
jgi:hypothetical protein